jgi:hypothetical protein
VQGIVLGDLWGMGMFLFVFLTGGNDNNRSINCGAVRGASLAFEQMKRTRR